MKGEVTILISGRVDFTLRTVSEIKESNILINMSMYLLPELQNKWYNNCYKWKKTTKEQMESIVWKFFHSCLRN